MTIRGGAPLGAALGALLAVIASLPARAIGSPGAREKTDGLEAYVGRSFFENPWVAAPSSTTARDGLGPLFNAHSCAACHPRGGSARAAGENGVAPTSLILRLGLPAGDAGTTAEPTYGTQLQTRGIGSGAARVPSEGTLTIEYQTSTVSLGDGELAELRRPAARPRDLAYGPIDPHACFSLRFAPSLRGVGVLEGVPDAVILARADPDDRDGDGISGRARTTVDRNGERRTGRFGHRAAQPSLRHQVAAAFRDDLGITSEIFPEQPCTDAESACRRAPSGASRETGIEIEPRILDAVTFMAARLAPPARAAAHDEETGRALFERAGCAGCHSPALTSPPAEPRVREPYTDLLLHDLGPGLADACDEPGATGSEWRTAPLWGLGDAAGGRRALLHDGRARGIAEAILWHGGEAQRSRDSFAQLDRADRERLIAFVASR